MRKTACQYNTLRDVRHSGLLILSIADFKWCVKRFPAPIINYAVRTKKTLLSDINKSEHDRDAGVPALGATMSLHVPWHTVVPSVRVRLI